MNSDIPGRSENLIRLVQRLRHENRNRNLEDSGNQESAAESVPREGTKFKRAAVLICLFEDERGDLRVVLTRRSSKLSSHSGEVALPGGKRDEKDADDVETALREAHEEIGLSPSMVEVVSVLEPFHTKTDIIVVPVVGVIWDRSSFNPIPNAAEVESVFDAPLEMFLKAASVVYQRPPAFDERRPPFWSISNR